MKAFELLEQDQSEYEEMVRFVMDELSVDEYTITDDGVELERSLSISNFRNLGRYMPIKLSIVHGTFDVDSSNVFSMYNFPHTIEGHFICSNNLNLKSTKYTPKIVKGSYILSHSGIEEFTEDMKDVIIGHDFKLVNTNISSLKNIPKYIGQTCQVDMNNNLSAWDLRYALFSNIGSESLFKPFTCKDEEISERMSDFFKLDKDEKHSELPNMLEFLKKRQGKVI